MHLHRVPVSRRIFGVAAYPYDGVCGHFSPLPVVPRPARPAPRQAPRWARCGSGPARRRSSACPSARSVTLTSAVFLSASKVAMRVVDGGLGVPVGEPPGVLHAGHLQHALGDRRRPPGPMPLGAGLSVTSTDPALPDDLERQRVWRAAAAFPRAASALDLDHVELGVVDGLPDRRPDLLALGPADARRTRRGCRRRPVIANLTLLPESVILWTMLTSRTSSARSGSSMSTICGSLQRQPAA